MKEPNKTVDLSAGPVRYRDNGPTTRGGEPILFVHGALVDGTLWRKLVRELKDEHRCIVPDLPLGAHRAPMNADADLAPVALARLIAEFIEALGLEGVTLVANDTGGALAQMLVAERPELVGRLVLTNCDTFGTFPPPMFKPLVKIGSTAAGLRTAMQPMRLKAMRGSALGYAGLASETIPDEIVRGWVEPILGSGAIRRDTAKVLRGMDAKDLLAASERLGAFGKPALVTWGTEDKMFNAEEGRRTAELLGARFVEIPGARAFLPEDRPRELAAEIEAFMAASPGGGDDVTAAPLSSGA